MKTKFKMQKAVESDLHDSGVAASDNIIYLT